MSDIIKHNDENSMLLAHSVALTNKVVANLSNDVAMLKQQRNDMKSEIQKNTEDIRKMKEAEGYIEARGLCILVRWPTNDKFTSVVGKDLTALSFKLGYEKKFRSTPRFEVGQYHPYVCKVYLKQKNMLIPQELKHVIKQ